jgi:hypothetical protein
VSGEHELRVLRRFLARLHLLDALHDQRGLHGSRAPGVRSGGLQRRRVPVLRLSMSETVCDAEGCAAQRRNA